MDYDQKYKELLSLDKEELAHRLAWRLVDPIIKVYCRLLEAKDRRLGSLPLFSPDLLDEVRPYLEVLDAFSAAAKKAEALLQQENPDPPGSV
jgi:hypothetical protein